MPDGKVDNMQTLWMAFRVELLKTRRSLAFMVALAAPLAIAVMQVAMYIDYMDFYLGDSPGNPWPTFNQTMLTYWALLMLPLFITLETALLAQMEHRQHNWKTLFSQPVPRWAVFGAKYLIGLLLLAVSSATLLGLMLGTGYFINLLYPGYGFTTPFPLLVTAGHLLLVGGASALILTIHTWISLRWENFVVPIVVGIVATVLGVFVFGSDYVYWYPWTISGALAMEIDLPNIASFFLGLSGLLLMIPACWDLARMDYA
jgi:hypothetical protein